MTSVSSVRPMDPPWPTMPRELRTAQRTAPPASDAGRAATPTTPTPEPETRRSLAIARAAKPDPEGRPAQELAGRQALQAVGTYAAYGSTQASPVRRLHVEA